MSTRNIIDLSEFYEIELDNLEVSKLDDEQMKTFLSECLDEEVENIWHIILDFNKGTHSMHLIDFDNGYLNDDHEIEIKLSDNLIVNAWVNIKFDIDYNCNNPRYDNSGCYHDYRAYSVLMKKFEVVENKNLPALVA
ncbi:hypothetical protein [Francisella marina]|uniref:hypothetical protein n=1 Tax=Francisella marina TaxID=2249302 RepID=UPI0011EC02B3|nr:hypothetical protein [Francisella marina]QEO58293.1 hypothetical protein F0R75_00350 [Francisella marina]